MIRIDPGYRTPPTAGIPAPAPSPAVEQPRVEVIADRRRGGDRRARQAGRGAFEIRSGRDRRRGYPGGPPFLDIEA